MVGQILKRLSSDNEGNSQVNPGRSSNGGRFGAEKINDGCLVGERANPCLVCRNEWRSQWSKDSFRALLVVQIGPFVPSLVAYPPLKRDWESEVPVIQCTRSNQRGTRHRNRHFIPRAKREAFHSVLVKRWRHLHYISLSCPAIKMSISYLS